MTSAPDRFAGIAPLEGLGLILREWTDEDVPALAELFDDPDVDRWTPLPAPFDLTAARGYLDRSRRRRAEGRGIQLAVTTDGRAALGEIVLAPSLPLIGGTGGAAAELGYAIGAAHRGQGLAARAVRLVTGFAHDRLAVPDVLLRIAADNAASAGVAKAAGFHLTAAEPVTRDDGHPLYTWRHSEG